MSILVLPLPILSYVIAIHHLYPVILFICLKIRQLNKLMGQLESGKIFSAVLGRFDSYDKLSPGEFFVDMVLFLD